MAALRTGVVDRSAVAEPFGTGIWEVRTFVRNSDTIPPTAADPLRWRDVIFDSRNAGSIGTTDTAFWQRYGRGYFRFNTNDEAGTATVWRTSFARDSVGLFTLRYERPDSITLRLWTIFREDTLDLELSRSDRHFQLAERQFHWLSEWNR